MSKYVLRNGVAVVSALNPPVNGLSQAVRSGILAGVRQAKQDGAKAVVLVGDGATFPAGADIAEFASGKWRDEPDLNQVIRELDQSDIPLVAAIHGTALGGGLETALSCNYRVALPSAKLGLPEVHLGILPGAGGTQRLPRVVGVGEALNMISTGRPVGAKQAHKLGLVDALIEGKTADDLVEGAVEFAQALAAGDLPRISAKAVEPVDDKVYDEARAVLKKKMRGQVAPQKIVDAVLGAQQSGSDFEAGMKVEETLFEELMAGPQSKAMQYMFFAERSCSKVPGVNGKLALDLKSVGVIGGGTMGRGIAMCFMNRGIPVVLSETTEEAAKACSDAIEGLYKKSSVYRSGKMTDDDLAKRMSLLSTTTDPSFSALKDCDAVIEAVFENMELKKDIFGRLGQVCKPEALLCTNTSYLDVDVIGEASGRPEKVLGTHFFSPANVMPLLENIRGAKSSEETIATAMKMGKTIGKTTVLTGNCFGFIGNRMFEPYTQQATCLVEEGAMPGQVDQAMGPQGFGFAMGPLATFDLAGVDIGTKIRSEDYYPHKPELVPERRGGTWMKLPDALVAAGRCGQKTGAGWYAYEGRAAKDDPFVANLAEEHRADNNIAFRENISQQEIMERCLFPLVNEGLKILEEGIAARPSDIDVVWIAGYGAPRYQPPMHYADNVVGLPALLESLKRYHGENPELPGWHFKPSELLEELVKSGKTLADYSKGR